MNENTDNPFSQSAEELATQIRSQYGHLDVPPEEKPLGVQPEGFLPPEEKNPFIELAGQLAKRNQEDADLQKKFIATRGVHSDWTQDQAQQAVLLSAAHPDVDPEVIARNLDTYSKSTQEQDLTQSLRDHPVLAKWMKDPLHASAIRDDTANLGAMEWLLFGKYGHVENYTPTPQEVAYAKANGLDPKFKQITPPFWQAAFGNAMDQQRMIRLANSDLLDGLDAQGKRELTALRRRTANRDFVGDDAVFPWLQNRVTEMIGMGPYIGGSIIARASAGLAGGTAGGLMAAELGPGTVAGAATGTAIGEHIGGQVWDFYQQVGPLYEDLLDLKHPDGTPVLTPKEAKNYALWTTLGTSTITAGFGGVVARAVPGIGNLMSSISGKAVSEGLAKESALKLLSRAALKYGESVGSMGIIMGAQAGATAGAEEIAKSRHGETGTWANVGRASLNGFEKGVEAAVLFSAWEPSRMLLHDSAKLANMHLDVMRIKATMDTAKNSSTITKNKELGQQVLSHMVNEDGSEVTEYHIDMDGFEELAKAEGITGREAAAQLFGSTKEFDQAKVDGASIAIPAEKFLTTAALTPRSKDFLRITKLAPDGVTLADVERAQTIQELRLKEIDAEIKTTGVDPYKNIENDFFEAMSKGNQVPEDIARAEAKLTAQRVKGWVAYYPKDMADNDPYLWYARIFSGLEVKMEGGQPKIDFNPETGKIAFEQMKNGTHPLQQVVELEQKPPPPKSGLTPEAEALIKDTAGVPAFITNNLRRIATENGIEVKVSDTGATVIEKLRQKAAQVPPAAGPEVAAPATTPPVKKAPAPKSTSADAILRGRIGIYGFKNMKPGDPLSAIIQIFKAHDHSTFSHEMAHFWFGTLASFAGAADAPTEMRADFDTLLKFAGYKDAEDRQKNINVKAEERIAYSWEKYLSEGKAPIAELGPTFRRFKLWMLKIYTQLGPGSMYERLYKQPLGMSLEVQRVFDRLLGANSAVEEATRKAGTTALEKLLQFMSPKEQEYYRRSVDDLKEAGEQKLIQHMREDEIRETKAWFRKEYNEQRTAANSALLKRPEYRALSILQEGKLPGGREPPENLRGLKLDPDTVFTARDLQDDTPIESPTDYPRGIWAKGGKSPDEVAYMLGFDGGDALLDGLKKTTEDGTYSKAVGLRAKARMTARYGAALLDDPQRLGDMAVDAINNQHQARKIMIEMRAMRKSLDPKAAPLPLAISPEALQATADRVIQGKMLKDLDASRYLTAQRFASQRAFEALEKGNVSKAYTEKEYELLTGFLYRSALKAKAEAADVETRLRNMGTDTIRKRLGLANPVIREVSDSILEAIGIKDRERGDAANRGSVSAWEAVADKLQLEIPYDADNLREAVGGSKNFKNMTLDEAKDVTNALASIQHYGRTLYEIATEKRRVDLQTAVNEMATDMRENLPFLGKAPAAKTQDVGFWKTVTRRLQAFDGAALDPEVLFGWMGDSAKKYIWDRYIESRNTHDDLARKVTDWFHTQWSKLPKELQNQRYKVVVDFDKTLPIPEEVNLAGARDHTTLWMIALNMGNESNKQRMLDGFGWNEAQVMSMLNKHMTKAEWDWVQSVWHLADKELWPHIAAKQERTTGVPPDKIMPSKIVTPHGVYEGGYFPAKYEPRASYQSASQVGNVQQTNTTLGRMGTIKSYTKARAASYNDVMSLQWSEVPNHVSQVIYDVAFDEYVRDMKKVLSNQQMQDTMYQRLGSQRSLQINDWLGVVQSGAPNGVARGVRELTNGVLGGLRSRAVLSSIGWSLSVAAGETSHPLAIMASGKISPIFGAPVLAEMIYNYGALRDQGLAISKELPHRAESVVFQLRQELNQVGETGPRGPVSKAYQAVRDTAFFFVQHLDHLISTWTFTSAYREALSKGLAPEDAAKSADAIIRGSLPTHSIAEQSALLREKNSIGSLFMFYGYFNKLYNMTRTIVHDPAMSWIEAKTPGQKATAAGQSAVAAGRVMAMLFMATGAGEFLSGRGREDDETWGQWAARKGIAAPFSIIPLAGPIADQAAGIAITGKRKQISMRSAPALAWADDMFKSFGTMVDPHKQNDEKAWEALKVVLSTVGLPGARQITRTGRYLTSGEAGRDVNRGQYGSLASGVVYGEKAKHQPMTPATSLEALFAGRRP